MKSFSKFLITVIALGCFAVSGRAQDSHQPTTLDDAIAGYEAATHARFQGLATDWSSHHVVYSAPAPGSDAEYQVQKNPRYWMQQIRRGLPESEASIAAGAQADGVSQFEEIPQPKSTKPVKNKKQNTLKGLWEVNLDSGATTGAEMYPATFTAGTSPSCANAAQPDFVVYNTNIAGAAPVAATANPAGTFVSTTSTPSGTYIITSGANSVTLTASGSSNTGLNFQVFNNNSSGNRNTNAANLAAAIVRNNATIGVTATSNSSAEVIVTALNAGTDGNSITLTGTLSHFTFNQSALAGGANNATIMAFDNLYTTTCASDGSVPTPYWSYNTGGTDHTSPIISNQGDQVAFVQSSAAPAAASLVVLKYAAGNGHLGSVVPATSGSYPSCTAPCAISIPFSGGANDTNSSPFYEFYGPDTIYVGDNAGKLHKFINVFLGGGTPSEVTTGGWPVTVSTHALSSPVADVNTDNIFVGDSSGNVYYVRDTGSTTGTCKSGSPPCLGSTTIALGSSVTDGPLLDVTIPAVYWFAAQPGTGSAAITDYVEQTNESLGATRLVTIPCGSNGTATGAMHSGAFDNNYYASPSSGHLYVCAVDTSGLSTHRNRPALYRIGFTGSSMNTTTASGPLDIASTNATANECSPITEVYNSNNSTDYFFASVETDASFAPCSGTGSCIYSFTIGNSGTFPTTSTDGLASTAGTSGISIDNTFDVTGASQVYFTPLGNQACTTLGGTGGCATQASQAALE